MEGGIKMSDLFPYVPINQMRGFDGFIEDDFGLKIAHSDNDAKVIWRYTPHITGTYKFHVIYASTVDSQTVNGDIRIGSYRLGEAINLTRYLPLTTFNLECSSANIPLKLATASFTIDTTKEVIIVRWRKNSNSGSGDFYILQGILWLIDSFL